MRGMVLLLAVVAAAQIACGSDEPNAFGLTIPDDVTEIDDAVRYVQREEQRRATLLYDSSDVTVTAISVAPPLWFRPEFAVNVQAASRDDALRLKERWAGEFRKLFDRWDICSIDIEWELQVKRDGLLQSLRPRPGEGSLLDQPDVSPGCDGPAFSERHIR